MQPIIVIVVLACFFIQKQDIWTGVCLVEHESNSNTHVVGTLNTDGSKDFGLFQINDRYWCNNGGWPGKECHVTCNDLISDDISKAATCAKKIYGIHGFRGWYAWIAHCQGGLPDISYC